MFFSDTRRRGFNGVTFQDIGNRAARQIVAEIR